VEGQIASLSWVLAGIVGLVLGIAAGLAFRWSERDRKQNPAITPPGPDDGVVRVLSVLRSAAVVLDADGDVVRASPPAYSLGLVRNDALSHASLVDIVDDVRRDGVIRDTELELPRGPIGPGHVLLRVRVASLSVDRVLLLAEDRTEAKRVEAIRRDFVVNVSHELKTPVGAIQLLAETIGDAADDPEAVRRFAGRLTVESKRLSALIREIIELSRVQAASSINDMRTLTVADIVAEAVDRAQTQSSAKNIVITASGGEEALVYGDRDLLVQAIRNLLDNAVAYSNPNTRVGVGVRERDGIISITVVDQGMGIKASDQDRIFERFYRADPARSRDTGGTGLGLSIVKHVVADHGGDIHVWSAPGKGSTFTLRLPAAEAQPALPDDDIDGDIVNDIAVDADVDTDANTTIVPSMPAGSDNGQDAP
jgi:two-component system sensor histidine kinase SenX3